MQPPAPALLSGMRDPAGMPNTNKTPATRHKIFPPQAASPAIATATAAFLRPPSDRASVPHIITYIRLESTP